MVRVTHSCQKQEKSYRENTTKPATSFSFHDPKIIFKNFYNISPFQGCQNNHYVPITNTIILIIHSSNKLRTILMFNILMQELDTHIWPNLNVIKFNISLQLPPIKVKFCFPTFSIKYFIVRRLIITLVECTTYFLRENNPR